MAWHLGVPAATIALDHLLTWKAVRMDARVQPSFAHFTLLRSAIESAAIARWLCQPTVERTERIRRAAGVQLDDYGQRQAYERRAKFNPGPHGRTADQRIAALERLLRRTDCAPIQMPKATELFGRYLFTEGKSARVSGENFSRMISAISHGKVWSLFGISEVGAVVSPPNARRAAPVSANEQFAFTATGLAMRLASVAGSDIETYGNAPTALPQANKAGRVGDAPRASLGRHSGHELD